MTVMRRVLDGADEIASAEARITSIARQPTMGSPKRPADFRLSKEGAVNRQVLAPARRVEI